MAIPHLFYKKYKEAIPFSGAPTSLIKNMKVGMPFSVAHLFNKQYDSGDTL
jgi:hypothetical protein